MIQASPEPPVIPDYELLKPIGRGSYGEVWLARSVTGVFRVIKVVRRDRFGEDRPFRRELEGITRFQSAASGRPRQLALLHVGRNVEAGYFYYVMEPADDAEAGSAIDPDRYVPLTLKELLSRRGRLPASECVQLALELARGLAVLHEAQLIHRDIKPSNIIFVQGVPKLADVGLVAASEATMTCVGTPGYVPPEGPGSPSADLYSFGKVLYEISTGLDRMDFPRLPPSIDDSPDTPLLREINSIVLRACHPDPRERQPSAAAIARELELVQAGKSVAFYEGLRRQLRVLVIGAVIVVAVAAVIVGSLLWRSGILRRANEKSRQALYRSDLAVAQLAKASGDLGRARAALQRQVPAPGESDLRGIEWSILAREVRGEGAPLEPATNGVAIRKITADPTGRWVAASFADDRVGVWDLRTGHIVRMIDGIRVLGGFSPEGTLVCDEINRALRFESPTNGTVSRLETGQRLLALLSDGRFLVVSREGDFVVQLREGVNLRPKLEFNVTKLWPGFRVSAFDISPDGTRFAIGLLREDGAQRERWLTSVDFLNGREIWRKKLEGRIVWLHCAPDSVHFVVNVGGLTPVIFRLDEEVTQIQLRGHTARVQDAAFSRSGNLLATAGADQTVRVWNVQTGNLLSTHRGLGRPTTAVVWLPGERHVVAGDDTGSSRVFEVPASEVPNLLYGMYDDVYGDLIFSTTGETIAVTTTTNSVALVASDNLKVISQVTNIFQPIVFTKDSKSLWAFASDWRIRRIDIKTRHEEDFGVFLPPEFLVHGWATSPDGKKIALGGTAGRIALIDLGISSVTNHIEADGNPVWALSFSFDSQEFWTGTAGGQIRRRRASDGALLNDVASLSGEVQALALSEDGRWTAAAIFNDASVRVWDRKQSKWLPALLTHRRFVHSLLFTRNNTRLISGGTDGRIVIWRVPEFEEIAAFEVDQALKPVGDEGIAVLRLGPLGQLIGALTEDGRLQVWRTL